MHDGNPAEPAKLPKLKVKQLFKYLEESRPEGDWGVVPDQGFDYGWSSLRIHTPFFYPDNERIYVYSEVADGNKRLVRLYDDEVTHEYLVHRDMHRTFLKMRIMLNREVLAPLGMRFTTASGSRFTISTACQPEEVYEKIPIIAGAMNEIVMRVHGERQAPQGEPLIDKIVKQLAWSPRMGIAAA